MIFGAGKLGKEWAFDFFTNLNVSITAYCDNNSKLWGEEINGRKIISPNELATMANNVIVLLIMRWDAINEVKAQLENLGIDEVITYTEIVSLDGLKKLYFPFMDQKIAVYTCVTDSYDDLKEHDFVSDKCDYFFISDQKPKKSELFEYLDIRDFLPANVTDPTRQNRYCKINAHKIFPQYRYSIYADANIVFTRDFLEVINQLPKSRIAVGSKLPDNCIFTHAIRGINGKRDKMDLIFRQMQEYWTKGMPENFGCYWCNVLAREHNNPICRTLMDEWWEQIEMYSRRDQLSLPYVIWKNGFEYQDVGIIDKEYERTLIPKYWKYSVGHAKPWATV